MSHAGPFQVLMLVSSDGLGGGQSIALRLARKLHDRGHEVSIGAPAGGALEARAKVAGLPFADIPIRSLASARGALALARWMAARPAAIVHTHLTRAALWGGLVGRSQDRPVVAHAHGLDRPRYYLLARRVLAVSGAVGAHLGPSLGDRVEVIPSALEAPDADPGRARHLRDLLAPGGGPLVLVAGKLHPNKGQRIAVEALAHRPGTVLALAGDGPDADALGALAVRSGVADRVRLLGWRDDVPDLMVAADIVLVPSAREGFGLAAAEALMLGRPLVARRSGGVEEIAGDAAVFIDSERPDELADALGRVMTEHARWGARARARGEELLRSHTPAAWVDAIEGVYTRLTPRPRQKG